ncbi:hypothetical protein N8843_02390 [Verrucomicrobia bacterium]|nr:hypothetical protein [Verrucomicrobiota bacterium]MDA7660229.1 hypothetical protein [Verrucomicrobiota bacterium]
MSLPFTFRGIADWAVRLKTGVLINTLLTGFVAAGVVGWFVWINWLPVWETAIMQFPAGSIIEKQVLSTNAPVSKNLASNHFLSISIRTDTQKEISSTSDLRIILDTSGVRIGSLFGYLRLPYPAGYIIELDSEQVHPWWLSRSFFLYLGAFTFFWIGFSLSWRVLALIYTTPVFILTYLSGRRPTFGIVFRLNLLSLMPPALFMIVAVILHGLEQLNLQEFLVANAIHFPMGWMIVVLSARHLEISSLSTQDLAKSKQVGSNPVDITKPTSTERKPRNPFSSSDH